MAEWSEVQTCNLEVLQGSSPSLNTSWICFIVVPCFKSSATLVNKNLVSLPARWDFKIFMFIFHLFLSIIYSVPN